jgi:apolipoprotein N-acyltransferase
LDSAFLRIAALTASGAMLWFGTGLHPIWWLTWIAPLPVLFAARRANATAAFFLAFGAWAIGDMNQWQYLHGLIGIPLGPSSLAIAGPALVFAAAVIFWRAFARRGAPIRAALGFAAVWVTYELASQKLSVNSTFGNIAYSQMDFLPVVQIASLAGVAGISFLLFFVPAMMMAIPRRAALLLIVPLALLGWGEARSREKLSGPTVKVGLIASDEPANLRPRDAGKIQKTFADYAEQAQRLIEQGAEVVVIPEKTAVISGDTVKMLDRIVSGAAGHGAVFAVGVERWTDAAKLNEIRFFGRGGQMQATYEKHHMLPPFESNLLPGNSLTVLDEPSGKWGLEICKDMDFPALSRQYGNAGVALLLTPAWDFEADGWYHGRMAILRGVESGFSIARAVKQGVLTVSDDRGRVMAERATNAADFATVLAAVPVHHDETLYDRWGDWFGWLTVAALGGLIVTLLVRRGIFEPAPPDSVPRS